jgi:hypothetical protein
MPARSLRNFVVAGDARHRPSQQHLPVTVSHLAQRAFEPVRLTPLITRPND